MEPMDATDQEKRELVKLEWLVLGVVGILVTLVEIFSFAVVNVPAVECFVEWIVVMGLALGLVQFTFKVIYRLQDRVTEQNSQLAAAFSARMRVEETLRRRSQELQALNAMAMKVTNTLVDVQEVLRNIQERMTTLLPEKYPPLFTLFDEKHQTWSVIVTDGHKKALETVERLLGVRLEEPTLPASKLSSAVQDALHAGKPYVTNDGSDILAPCVSRELVQAAQKALGVRCIVDLPVSVKGKLVGAMILLSQKEKVSDREMELLSSIGSQAAILIENARLSEAAQEELTKRNRAEEALRETEERYRTFFEQLSDAVYTTTREGKFVEVNQSFLELFGYTREEIMELNAHDLYADPTEWPTFQKEIEQTGAVVDYELKLRKRDGTEIESQITATVRRGEDRKVVGYQGIICDIALQNRLEETFTQLAYYDTLTGLPNRALFNDRLGMALAHSQRNQHKLAVMLLDLDRFKDVNDELGHAVGDQLLQAVGNRLTTILRESDTVCRVGGDEFLLLLPEIARAKDAAAVAERVLEAIREPFALDAHELLITTSLGIAIYPDDGEDGDTLVRNADIAMYRAKEQGRDNYERYTPMERLVVAT